MNLTGPDSKTNLKPKAVAIIPARFASVRLPGKALLEIADRPMICWVAEQTQRAKNVSRVIVATDDQRILDAVRLGGFEGVMTRSDHASGTDRIAEVAATLDDAEIIVNVQGDEPLISSLTIERAVSALSESFEYAQDKDAADREIGIVTTWEPIGSPAEVLNPDVVKIIVDDAERAVYFSRSVVPYPREAVRKHGSVEAALLNDPVLLGHFRKHTGLYAYRRDVLLQFTTWQQTELERVESLEQLRALEHGVKIRAIEASTSSIGVDTVGDLERVRTLISSKEFQVSGLRP